ncbi:MAG: dipeptidase [Planctomycetales bacterium]
MTIDHCIQDVDQYLTRNADRFLEELKALLRIRSVSADSTLKGEVRRAAEFVREQLASAGLAAELIETPGNPIVYGEWLGAAGAPTVLIYGHYDVQPPDPLNEWISPPFEPTIRDGKIFARGATDDKGQFFTHVKSIEAWMKTAGRLPVNVKVVIEGEEEVGSRNLDDFLERSKSRLAADVAVISDTAQYGPDLPAITYGLRGIISCEIALTGPSQDLHSGVFGGAVANPAIGLARILGALHDETGHVRVPGFYDDVRPLNAAEQAQLAALPFDESQFLAGLGVAAGWGEREFSIPARMSVRPTCDVNGMASGYIGEGPKTIIPSTAFAKITCRMVPDQNPSRIFDDLEAWVRRHCLPGLELEFKRFHQSPGIVFDMDSRNFAAARRAIELVFGRPPVMIREGGSIPVVMHLKTMLGIETLLLGWGQNSDNLHGPNEHFSLRDFSRGIRTSARLWEQLGQSGASTG